jgi:gliding motility-associated-like protein
MKFWSPFFIFLFAISKASLSQITITFTVDMSGQSITPQGVRIAGQFALVNAISITQNWQPGAPGSQLTLVSGSTYSIQVVFPLSSAGKKMEFEFVRSNIWFGSEDYSEGNPGDPNAYLDNSCGVPDGGGGFNRIITIPACGGQFTTLWNYCGTLSSTLPPSLTVSSPSQICPGQSILISATSNGNVEWSPSTGLSCTRCNNPVATPAISTFYKAKSTMGGCSVIDSVLITVDGNKVNAGHDQNITPGTSTQLSANGSGNYNWQPTAGLSCSNCPSPVASPSVTTSYIVSGTSGNGCKSFDTVTVFVSKSPCGDMFFPGAFTPNDDGVNDKFGPLTSNAAYPSSAIFRVYSRWGELIFETKDLNHRWDGKFRGIVQATGNYVYYLSLDCNGKSTVMKGTVTLIK